MKKLMTLMIGLGLVLGTTAAVFARPGNPQDDHQEEEQEEEVGDHQEWRRQQHHPQQLSCLQLPLESRVALVKPLRGIPV